MTLHETIMIQEEQAFSIGLSGKGLTLRIKNFVTYWQEREKGASVFFILMCSVRSPTPIHSHVRVEAAEVA